MSSCSNTIWSKTILSPLTCLFLWKIGWLYLNESISGLPFYFVGLFVLFSPIPGCPDHVASQNISMWGTVSLPTSIFFNLSMSCFCVLITWLWLASEAAIQRRNNISMISSQKPHSIILITWWSLSESHSRRRWIRCHLLKGWVPKNLTYFRTTTYSVWHLWNTL